MRYDYYQVLKDYRTCCSCIILCVIRFCVAHLFTNQISAVIEKPAKGSHVTVADEIVRVGSRPDIGYEEELRLFRTLSHAFICYLDVGSRYWILLATLPLLNHYRISGHRLTATKFAYLSRWHKNEITSYSQQPIVCGMS